VDLGQRREPVREELQALLTGRDVEAPVRNRQAVRRRLEVVNGRAVRDRSPPMAIASIAGLRSQPVTRPVGPV
jgi:hypothetical protein